MNLYSIEQDFVNIFAELEENGGELNEELEKKLEITQENFNSKVENYCKYIKNVANDANSCKEEAKRLKLRADSKAKQVERLKETVTNAMVNFAPKTKGNVPFMECGIFRVSVRTTKSTVVDEQRLNAINAALQDYYNKINDDNLIYDKDTYNQESFLEFVNNYLKENGFKAITKDDLEVISITVGHCFKLNELFTSINRDIIIDGINDFHAVIDLDVDKAYAKSLSQEENYKISIIDFEENKSLQIK